MPTSTVTVPSAGGPVEVSVAEQGEGHPFLLLHGGAGPQSVADVADLLAGSHHARVLTPTHPGFAGTGRPNHLASVAGLADLYRRLLDVLDLRDVTVVGNSLGGWIAAEIALLGSSRISSLVLVDAVGLHLDTHPIVDFFALTLDEVTERSYYQPARHRTDLDALPDAARAAMAGNRAALLAYGGTTMADPTLRGRLSAVAVPTLVVWGLADRIVDPEHARVYADEVPAAQLDLIDTAGHLPQLETPHRLVADVWAFADQHAAQRPAAA